MRILKPITDQQELKVIPRSYPEIVDVVLTNEETNEQVTLSDLSVVSDGGYLNIVSVFDFTNDTFYTFRVYEATTTNEIYYGKIFVTDQPTDSYSIQDGTYQTITKDNEYIIYGK